METLITIASVIIPFIIIFRCLIIRFRLKLFFKFQSCIIKTKRDKYLVYNGWSDFFDTSGDSWSTDSYIIKYCLHDTYGEALKTLNKVTLKL